MLKLVEDKKETFYESITKISTVSDLKKDKQYIFVQEEGYIAIWQVTDKFGGLMDVKNAVKDLDNYYKKTLGRTFDLMQKKLVSL